MSFKADRLHLQRCRTLIMIQSKTARLYRLPQYSDRYFVSLRKSHLASLQIRRPCVRNAIRRVINLGCFRPQSSTPSQQPPVQYHWIDGVEHLELYEPGGYHSAMIDDLLHNRYRIVDKLGFGGYSTIWLARDETAKRYVGVKIGISRPSLPRREPEILRALSGSGSSSEANCDAGAAVPTILDAFNVCGPNGTHPCYTLTPAQGNLKEASFSRLFPIKVARALAAKLAHAVAFVHSRGFVHGGLSSRTGK